MKLSKYSQRLCEVIRRLESDSHGALPTVQTNGKSRAINGGLDDENIANLALDETHDADHKKILNQEKGQESSAPMGVKQYADRLAKVVSGLNSRPDACEPQGVLTSDPGVSGGGKIEEIAIKLALDPTFDGNAKHIVDIAKLV